MGLMLMQTPVAEQRAQARYPVHGLGKKCHPVKVLYFGSELKIKPSNLYTQ